MFVLSSAFSCNSAADPSPSPMYPIGTHAMTPDEMEAQRAFARRVKKVTLDHFLGIPPDSETSDWNHNDWILWLELDHTQLTPSREHLRTTLVRCILWQESTDPHDYPWVHPVVARAAGLYELAQQMHESRATT